MAAVLPRIFATILLIVSLSMMVPLAFAVNGLVRGGAVMPIRWILPLAIIGVGAVLMNILSRKQVPLQLFLFALALWLLTAGYYWFRVGV